MLQDQELTRSIIRCAMNVHSSLGNGFQEVVYQRALAIELLEANLEFQREVNMDIFYKSHLVGTRRVDFLVEKKVLVELKSLIKLEAVHLAQAKNYLEAFCLPTGLLINFGSKSLEFRRLFNEEGVKKSC